MYCTQCGKKIEDNSKFCTNCGTKLTVEEQPQVDTVMKPQTYAQQADEQVIWVFAAQRKFSLIKMVVCNIVFMKDKLVLAHLTNDLRKAESEKVSQEIKEEGKGFFKGSAHMMRYWADFHNRYYQMTSAQILAEDPMNIEIPYQNIVKVLFRGLSETVDFDDSTNDQVKQGKLEFTLTNKDKINFIHSQSAQRSVKDTLTNIFGSRLKYKR